MNRDYSLPDLGTGPAPSGPRNRWPRRFLCRECGRDVGVTTSYPNEVWEGPRRSLVWNLRRQWARWQNLSEREISDTSHGRSPSLRCSSPTTWRGITETRKCDRPSMRFRRLPGSCPVSSFVKHRGATVSTHHYNQRAHRRRQVSRHRW